ncbi:SixA phosphatase family protein [Thermoactinospora rubra]|uniref:SixA phosphatase family protein n=1 Tax=Thermoactinospora rubra TaxID=1088767 RepID=UPI001F0A5DD5|nr:histidine phosphatase family protein [Thermoactinospora rubra]
MRRLILLRHAKAAHVLGLADRERPLTGRGERDARRAGEELRARGLNPDLVLSSPSVRTRRTAELAFPGAEIGFEREIYEADPEDLLDVVRRTGEEVSTLVLCGHNPAIEQLAGGDHMRPGAFAVFEVGSTWAQLWPEDARLVARWDPKEDAPGWG